MGVEHFVCEARTLDPNRQSTESDAIDLQHTVLGLSYCDVLVTERYAASTAAYAIKALAPLPLATLHRSFGPDILNANDRRELSDMAPRLRFNDGKTCDAILRRLEDPSLIEAIAA
jgi:hypothetical protein